MHHLRPRAPILLCVALGCLAGCGPEPKAEAPPRVAVYPVAGTLRVNGQPAANAMIAFHPRGTTDKRAPHPVAVTASDGTYRLTTSEPGDGAPAGEYAVPVLWIDATLPTDECVDPFAHDRFQGR